MDNRILVAKFKADERYTFTDSLFQYDYGQELKIDGLELPDTFEVHFSNELHGNSTTSLYTNGTVVIPDTYLTSFGKVYAWIYLHDTENDGETEYSIIIDVKARAKITNATPTPVQQDIITQAIAALNAAVSECESNVAHYPKIGADGYWYVWDASDEDWTNTNVKGVVLGHCYITNNGVSLVAVLPDQTITTKEGAKSWFSNNPTTFIYKLATPVTYQLTPQEVKTLTQCNIFADTGDVTCQYRIDLQSLVT